MAKPSETEIVERFFSGIGGAEGLSAPGDDCAMLTPPEGRQLVLSVDTSASGRHFPAQTPARDIGWRCLAVALSDLAACGAEPDFCLLALSLPEADTDWLEAFSSGFLECAERYGVRLVGGDLVRGQLSVSVQVGGWVEKTGFIARRGAAAGDAIFVTGQLGAAAAGLEYLQSADSDDSDAHLRQRCMHAFLHPEPDLELGQQLAGLASACIDISDGLALDLGRLCCASGVGADLNSADLPLCAAGDRQAALHRALHAGDDYHLCFTLSPDAELLPELQAASGSLYRIGTITASPGISLDGVPVVPSGFEHF